MNNLHNNQVDEINPKINKKVLGYIFLLVVFVLGLYSLFLFNKFKSRLSVESININVEYIKQNEVLVQIFSQVVKKRLDSIFLIGTVYSQNEQLKALILTEKWTEAVQVVIPALREEPVIEKVFIRDILGIAKADYPSAPELTGLSFANRDWYKGVTTNFKPYLSGVYERITQPKFNIATIAFPIFDSKKVPIAIMGFQIKLDVFYQWTSDLKIGNSGRVFIVDQTGKIVAHPKYPSQSEIVDFSQEKDVQKALSGKSGSEIVVTRNEATLSSYEFMPDFGWAILSRISGEEVKISR